MQIDTKRNEGGSKTPKPPPPAESLALWIIKSKIYINPIFKSHFVAVECKSKRNHLNLVLLQHICIKKCNCEETCAFRCCEGKNHLKLLFINLFPCKFTKDFCWGEVCNILLFHLGKERTLKNVSYKALNCSKRKAINWNRS